MLSWLGVKRSSTRWNRESLTNELTWKEVDKKRDRIYQFLTRMSPVWYQGLPENQAKPMTCCIFTRMQ